MQLVSAICLYDPGSVMSLLIFGNGIMVASFHLLGSLCCCQAVLNSCSNMDLLFRGRFFNMAYDILSSPGEKFLFDLLIAASSSYRFIGEFISFLFSSSSFLLACSIFSFIPCSTIFCIEVNGSSLLLTLAKCCASTSAFFIVSYFLTVNDKI